MAQVVEYLPRKHKTLNSNPGTEKKKLKCISYKIKKLVYFL
jgi:hypothetical protein